VLWGATVLAVLTWQAATYRGLVARAAEWQYAKLGTYFPIPTIIFFLLLFTLPLLMLLTARIRRRRQLMEAGPVETGSRLETAWAVNKLLLGVTAAPLIVAALLLAMAMTIHDGPARQILPSSDAGIEGPVRIKAILRLNRLSSYRPALSITGRPIFFAPLTEDDATGPTLRYFAEVDQITPAAPKSVEIQGVAAANALPGTVRRLYLDAGYRVADRTYVVYRDAATARRRYTDPLPVLLVIALIFGAVTVVHRRSVRRLGRGAPLAS